MTKCIGIKKWRQVMLKLPVSDKQTKSYERKTSLTLNLYRNYALPFFLEMYEEIAIYP